MLEWVKWLLVKLFSGTSERTETRLDFQAHVDAALKLIQPLTERIAKLETDENSCQIELSAAKLMIAEQAIEVRNLKVRVKTLESRIRKMGF